MESLKKSYIEYRVYLEDVAAADIEETANIAEDLKDQIVDIVSDEYASGIFTQDVTYEVRYRKE